MENKEQALSILGTESYILPSFLRKLWDPTVKTVLLCGCGGGFDFVHSMNLYPELRRLNKTVVIVSFSFGDVGQIGGTAPVVWEDMNIKVKEVSADSQPLNDRYAPEIHVCTFLDSSYPQTAPHKMYACNARQFTVPRLTAFYTHIINQHKIDGVIIFDGGSDSLMRGDEEGLGDPIEDCVSVTSVSLLKNEGIKFRILISAGFGSDRFNGVSDASSLRAVAEITQMGGFLGSLSLEPTHPGFLFYSNCVKHIYSRQSFRSVLTGLVILSTQGHFGFDISDNSANPDGVKVDLGTRVSGTTAFCWPLMAILFAFDVNVVAKRSYIATWIKDETTVSNCHEALYKGRKTLKSEQKIKSP